jgi:hypothetical protein
MLMEDGAGNDSLLLSRRFELSEMMDSLVSQIDSFMTLGYSQIAEYANTLRDEIAAYDFTLPQAKTEKDYLLFFLKYGQWSTDTLTQEDSTLLSDIAHLCAYEYGSVVYWARNIYMEWYEEELDDAEICGTGSRMASAISPKESSLQVKLIPNPASKEVVLQLEGDAIEYSHTQVGIFHITGEQLFSQEFTGKSTTLALETFPAGSYLVKVILQEGEVLYKKTVSDQMKKHLFLIGMYLAVCQLAIAQYHDAKWVLCYGQTGYQNNVIVDFGTGQSPQALVTNTVVPNVN